MQDDLISRAVAIEAMEAVDWYHINSDGQLVHGANSKEDEPLYKAEDVYKVLNDVPSAQPEPKTGKWIKMSDADGTYYCCSECGEELYQLYRVWTFGKSSIAKAKYCSYCGTRMEDNDE